VASRGIHRSQKTQEDRIFYEITENAVKEALAHPRAIDQHLRKAQEARRVLDRLLVRPIGPRLEKKSVMVSPRAECSRPHFRIIMEKEREIRAFVP